MEVRIHFTHGLPSTNQVDLSMGRLQNPSSFRCSHSKESLCTKHGQNIMCLAVSICFSYSFVEGGGWICMPKGVMAVWKSNVVLEKPVCDPDFRGVTRPMWAHSEHSLQGLRKSQSGDFRLKYPMDVKGKHSTPLGTLQHVVGLKCSLFKNSVYSENNSSSWNLTQLGQTSFQTVPEWKQRRDNYQNHVKLHYLPAPLNEGCVHSSSLLFSQGKKMEGGL